MPDVRRFRPNFVDGVAGAAAPGGVSRLVRTHHGDLSVPVSGDAHDGGKVAVVLRPEHLSSRTATRGQGRNRVPNAAANGRWPASIVSRAFLGDSLEHVVQVGSSTLRVREPGDRSFPPGSEVVVVIDESRCSAVAV